MWLDYFITRVAAAGSVTKPGGFFGTDPATGDNIVRRGFNTALSLGAVLSVAMIVYAGIKYIMAHDAGKIKEAQGMLTYAIMGLIIVLTAFVIAEFIASLVGASSIFNTSPFSP